MMIALSSSVSTQEYTYDMLLAETLINSETDGNSRGRIHVALSFVRYFIRYIAWLPP